MQPAVRPRSSANGSGRRRGERVVGNRTENKAQSGKSNYGRLANAGLINWLDSQINFFQKLFCIRPSYPL